MAGDRNFNDDSGVSAWLRSLEWAAELVHAKDARTIAELESRFGFDQAGAVTHFVEQTEWGMATFPEFQGGHGTSAERLTALLSKWELWEKGEPDR